MPYPVTSASGEQFAPPTEPAAAETLESILRPKATPVPTQTPGVIVEMISEFTESQGLQDTTVFHVRVEDWLNLGLSIIQIIIVGFLLSRLIYIVLTKITARTVTRYDDILLTRIRSQIFLVMVVFGFQVGTLRLPFLDVFAKQFLNQIYIALYVVAATVIIWRLLDVLVEWYRTDVEPKRDVQEVDSILVLLHRFGRLLLVTISTITLLSLYNINVNALIAALGVGGLALSLAAQDTLSNVIGGIILMMDQPFRVGDRIEIQRLGTWGDVVDIGLRSTRIRTRDNRMVIVPNNTISTDQIVNYTYPDSQYRIQMEVGVDHGQDIEKIRRAMVDTVRRVDGVLPSKPVDALYVDMGESVMTFQVRWWIESYKDTRHMFDLVNTALQYAFDQAGIKLAVNTIDVNLSGKQSSINTDSEPNA